MSNSRLKILISKMHLFYFLPQFLSINLVFLYVCFVTLLILLGNRVCFFSSNIAYRRTDIFISCTTNFYLDISTLTFQNITNSCEKLKTWPLPKCALSRDFPLLVNDIYILLFHRWKTSQNIISVNYLLFVVNQ